MSTFFRVLGPLEVIRDGEPLKIGGPKQKTVLAVLVSYADRTVSADLLIEELWGDETPSNPGHALNVYLSELRKTLEPNHRRGEKWSVIQTVDAGYRLAARDEIDSFEAERLLTRATEANAIEEAFDLLGRALELWAGRPFGDLESTSTLAAERARLDQLRLSIQEAYFEAGIRLGRHDDLIGQMQSAMAENPFSERLAGHLMLSLYRAGRQADALSAFRDFSRRVGDELGLEPGAELRELEEKILLRHRSLDPISTMSNLPSPPTSFIGRDADIEAASSLLDTTRLLTLTGPGGVGKTRLAIELAHKTAERFPDGAWVVEMAPLREEHLVGLTVARVLDIDPQPDRPIEETIAARLRDARLLLILDNCEHLIEAAARLTKITITTCPGVTIVATSREALNIVGETQMRVSPLDGAEAAELFAERARSHDRTFEVTGRNAGRLARICQRLDGMPLAVELAAVRAQTMSLEQIEHGLEDRFSLLTRGDRTADVRQQTLEAAIDWSHDLLEPDERTMLRRLSVFRGSFSLDAVRDLHETLGDESEAIDFISGLASKSLVTTQRVGDEIRYELLESIRQYARAKVHAANEWDDLVAWHLDWFRSALSNALPNLTTADQLEWLAFLEGEHDNLRAALERATDRGDIEVAIGLTNDLLLFWFLHSHYSEAMRWVDRLVPHLHRAQPAVKAQMLIGSARLFRAAGSDRARPWLQEAVRCAENISSPEMLGWAWAFIGLIDLGEKKHEDSIAHTTAALESFQEAEAQDGIGFALWLRSAANYIMKRSTNEDTGDEITVIEGLIKPVKAVGERNLLGHLGYSMGLYLIDHDRAEEAVEHIEYGTRALVELGNKACTAHNLDQVARVQIAHSDVNGACVTLAATKAIRDRLGFPGHPMEREFWIEINAEVEASLDPREYESAWERGYQLSFGRAVEHAMSCLAGSRSPAPANRPDASQLSSGIAELG